MKSGYEQKLGIVQSVFFRSGKVRLDGWHLGAGVPFHFKRTPFYFKRIPLCFKKTPFPCDRANAPPNPVGQEPARRSFEHF
jgi:hypothetical protein